MKYRNLTMDEIVVNFYNLYIESIKIEEVYSEDEKIIINGEDNPFVLINRKLFINPNWYLKNKKWANYITEYILENTENYIFYVKSDELITDDLISVISKNSNLEKVQLGDSNGNYKLTVDHYLKLKKTQIKKIYTNGVDLELENNFDSLIEYNMKKNLICGNSYTRLRNGNVILDNKFSISELDNLKYLGDNVEITISNDGIYMLESVCDKLKELNKNNNIYVSIKYSEKEKFNKIINGKDLDDNIYVHLWSLYSVTERKHMDIPDIDLSIREYLSYEQKLYDMIKNAFNLSPFEKYIFAYNVAKKYKKYKVNDDNYDDSRSIYRSIWFA